MNQTGLSGIPRPAQAGRAQIERQGDITNSQVVYGDNNVVIWGDGNTVVQKVTPNKRPKTSRLPAPVIVGRPAHPIRLFDRTVEKRSTRTSLASGAPLEFYSPPGFGKSTLLRYLSSELALPDGMVFLELRSRKTLDDLFQELFEAFFTSDQNYAPNEVQFKRYFENIQALILLDDVNLSREEIQTLRYALPRCVLVMGSTEQCLWGEGSAIPLRGLPTREAVALLRQQTGRKLVGAELPIAQRICGALEGNPLRIIEVGTAVRNERKSLEEIARRLETPTPEESMHELSLPKLPDRERHVLALLAVLGNAPLPAEHIAEILQTAELSPLLKDLLDRGLIKAHSPRYSLTGSLGAYLNRTWDLSSWRERVLRHFVDWSARPVPRKQVLDATDAVFSVMENAAATNRWREVLQIGQAVEPAFILGRRWGAWTRALSFMLRAGQVLGERAIEAWALHQIGSRFLCTGQFQQAREYLSRALEIRRAIGDKSGIAATKHNLRQLPGGSAPHNPSGRGGGPSPFKSWIIPITVLSLAVTTIVSALGNRPAEPAPDSNTHAPTSRATKPPALTPTPTRSRTATPPRTPSRTATPSYTPSPTLSATIPPPGSPSFDFNQNANCRNGPGTAYGQVTSFLQGETVEIKGQNGGDPRWWLVAIPDSSNSKCWVSDVTGSTTGLLDGVPVVVIAPPTTVTPTLWIPPTTPVTPNVPWWLLHPPLAPTGFGMTIQSLCSDPPSTPFHIFFSWFDVLGETGYRFYRDGSMLADLPANTTSYTDDSLDRYTNHSYYVQAYNALGASNSATRDYVSNCFQGPK